MSGGQNSKITLEMIRQMLPVLSVNPLLLQSWKILLWGQQFVLITRVIWFFSSHCIVYPEHAIICCLVQGYGNYSMLLCFRFMILFGATDLWFTNCRWISALFSQCRILRLLCWVRYFSNLIIIVHQLILLQFYLLEVIYLLSTKI